MRMSRVGNDKDANLELCQDGSRTNKRGKAEQDRGLGKGAGLINSPPMNLNERYRAKDQRA